MTIPEVVADVVLRLEGAGIKYAVGGSLASSVWGQTRYTNDADISILVDTSNVHRLTEAFPEPYYLPAAELKATLSSVNDFRCVQMLNMDEAFKFDLFLLLPTEYHALLLRRARRLPVTMNVDGNFFAPEDIVITKLRWFVLGNRVSNRQWNDIIQVLEVRRGELDDGYMEQWAGHFGVADLLVEAREQAYD